MVDFVLNNAVALVAVVVAALAFAKAVAKVTPTPKDDEILRQIESVVERVLGNGKPE